jgi:dihydroxyacetone kinase-like protein
MCDVWLPVVDSCASPASSTCRSPPRWMPPAKWRSGAHATITMQARKGRASYLGERSIGHQDPGATSVMFMMQMLAAAAKE